jgi:uncharacterized membrane protein required for colicin V production
MISLFAAFWITVVFFALVGAMRGWSKEVIAMAGLTLSLFTINTFGSILIRLLGGIGGDAPVADIMIQMRRQYWVLGSIHLIIAFFSYQSVALIRARLAPREKVQERLLGLIFGAVNGYLVIGTLWSLLEYRLTVDGWLRLPPNFPYAFDPYLTRPVGINPAQDLLLTHLPIPWLVPWLPILIVLIFLFVIVVVI